MPMTNWMSNLPDTTPLSKISIPGTHDSSTYLALAVSPIPGMDYVVCQHLPFLEQLYLGIRFLDLRVTLLKNGDLELCHDIVQLGATISDAFGQIKTFLTANPSETVLVCVKNDNPSAQDSTTMSLAASYLGGLISQAQLLYSPNGTYQAVFQTDGNFVVYRLCDMHVMIGTATERMGADKAVMQSDGNFVIYAKNKAVSATETYESGSGCVLSLQNDGNLVVYNASGQAQWDSRSGSFDFRG